ncbi:MULTISPECIES: hypothetical protein [Streptomyces]|uniref:Uncharacterized protein n=1 Tax=Streptomyces ramulosus TaxID=47762 RepID=A0ABW1FSN7_9ACTN
MVGSSPDPPGPGAGPHAAEAGAKSTVAGLGALLPTARNAPLISPCGVVTRPVRDISPSRFAPARRVGDRSLPTADRRPLVRDYVRAGEPATGARG